MKIIKTKEEAIQIKKDICDRNANLNLCIEGGCAKFSLNPINMTPEEWKHVGYISAIAFIFDIEEVE